MEKMKTKVMSFDELPVVIGVSEIMAVLGISRNTAYELLHSESFPAFTIGKQYRVQRQKFVEWIDGYGMVA